MDPGPIFTIDTSSTVTIYFLPSYYFLPHHTVNTLLQQTGEIDNLTVCWVKVLSLWCVGFQVACNTFETFPSSYWFDNLGFLLRENLLLCCIIPCSWGFPTGRQHASRLSGAVAGEAKDVFIRGVLLNLSLYFVFSLLSFFFLVLFAFFYQKLQKKIV